MNVYNILSAGKPIIAEITSGPASTHVVVIRGITFRQIQVPVQTPVLVPTPYGSMWQPHVHYVVQQIPFLEINDPLQPGPMEVSYDQLASVWRDSIVVE